MSTGAQRKTIAVLNEKGLFLSYCTWKKASSLISGNRAIRVDATTIRLKETKKERREGMRKIIEDSGRICYICGEQIPEDAVATIDHVVPRSKSNVADVYGNMLCCCERCNQDKRNLMPHDYIMKILENREAYGYISDERLDYLIGLFDAYEKEYKNRRPGKRTRERERNGSND